MTDLSAIFDPENDHLFTIEYALQLFKHVNIGEEECQHYNKKKDNEEDPSVL